MRKRGVYGKEQIKIDTIGIESFTETKLMRTSVQKLGDVVFLSGEWDKTKFNTFVMKDPDYNIMLMST